MKLDLENRLKKIEYIYIFIQILLNQFFLLFYIKKKELQLSFFI